MVNAAAQFHIHIRLSREPQLRYQTRRTAKGLHRKQRQIEMALLRNFPAMARSDWILAWN